MVELIKDFVRFDTVPSDLEGLYLITSVIIIFSIVIAFYFMISLVVSYVWSSFKLMKIFDNSARRSLRALSYIPLFNLSLFGVISRQKKGDEAHISFVALISTLIVSFFLPYVWIKYVVALALVVHFFDTFSKITKKYSMKRIYLWTLFMAPASTLTLVEQLEDEIIREIKREEAIKTNRD